MLREVTNCTLWLVVRYRHVTKCAIRVRYSDRHVTKCQFWSVVRCRLVTKCGRLSFHWRLGRFNHWLKYNWPWYFMSLSSRGVSWGPWFSKKDSFLYAYLCRRWWWRNIIPLNLPHVCIPFAKVLWVKWFCILVILFVG